MLGNNSISFVLKEVVYEETEKEESEGKGRQ